MWMTMVFVLLCQLQPGEAGPRPVKLFQGEFPDGKVDDTAVSPSGKHFAFLVRAAGGDVLYVDGKRKASHDRIEQVTVTDSGELFYWYRSGAGEFVAAAGRESGPYSGIRIPDIDIMDSLSRPSPAEWGFRGGTRVVFAARDATGDWGTVCRYPAAATAQERRMLPTTRVWHYAPDPTVETSKPLRYRLVRGKVPIFLGKEDDEECLVVGTKPVVCAENIAMLAYSKASGRLAYATQDREGLTLDSGCKLHGPTSNIDWVAFSPDGNRLAFIMKEKQHRVLIVDDAREAEFELIESLAWTSDNRLLYLAHGKEGAHLFLEGKPILEKPLISKVFLSPTDQVLAFGVSDRVPFLFPFQGLGEFVSLRAEGFLPSGEFYAQVSLPLRRSALLLDGKMSPSFYGISKLSISPDGTRLAGVGSTVDGDLLLVGTDTQRKLKGRADRLDWCPGGALLVREKQRDKECLVTDDDKRHCCKRIVAAGCGKKGVPTYACITDKGYEAFSGTGSLAEPYDDIPMQLIYQDARRGRLDFSARRGQEWFLVVDGTEARADGKPIFVYPADDGAWFLVRGTTGSRWVTRQGESPWYGSVKAPFFVDGKPVYLARRDGKETWVSPAGEMPWHDELLSAPHPFPGGFLFWARDAESRVLYSVSL